MTGYVLDHVSEARTEVRDPGSNVIEGVVVARGAFGPFYGEARSVYIGEFHTFADAAVAVLHKLYTEKAAR